MEANKTIASIGYICKEEDIQSYVSRHSYKQLILEGCKPYPGYYDFFERPEHQHDETLPTLYIVLKEKHILCDDSIIRITQKIKKENPHYSFDAVPGNILLSNMQKTVLRINLNSPGLLSEIILAYEKKGIVFAKHQNVKKYTSLIRLRKFFSLREINPEIYANTEDDYQFFIRIHEFIEWDDFKRITKIIKINCNLKGFDAALSNIYTKEGVIDYIRIWDKECSLEKLRKIKELYLTQI